MFRHLRQTLLIASLAVLGLAGCARDNGNFRANDLGSGYVSGSGVIATPVSTASAAAMLPPAAGRVIAISERRYADGLSQEIVLGSDRASHGENRIDISMRLNPQNDQVYDNLIPMQKPSDADIAGELQARFPGMDMEPVNVLLQNRYGPYGLAAGKRGNGERCIYAWQWIDDMSGPANPRLSALGSAILNQPQPASLRIRLCRTGVNADQLAGLVEGISIGGGMGHRQLPVLGQNAGYGNDALSAAGGLGGGSFQGYQLPQTSVLAQAEAQPRIYARPRNRIAARAKPRYRTARSQPAPEYAAEPQPVQQVYQPQVYAPQPQIYAPQAYVQRPLAVPARTPLRALDQSLPAEAYTGPRSANGQPVRVVPGTGALYNAAPAQPASGRLVRDPVVTGPGV